MIGSNPAASARFGSSNTAVGCAQPAGLLAIKSEDAHTHGQLHDPNHCEDDYQHLPTVSSHPVVQRSQYRLGFRRREQTADEDDLDNRKHHDDERDGGEDLRADRSSRGHDGSGYK
jgi:hypothetical protein